MCTHVRQNKTKTKDPSSHRKSLDGTVLLPSVASTSQWKTTPPPLPWLPFPSLLHPQGPCWGRGWDQRDQPRASPSSSRASSSSPKERQSFITAEDKTGAVGEQRAAQRPPPASCGDFPLGETWCAAFVLDSNFFFFTVIFRQIYQHCNC